MMHGQVIKDHRGERGVTVLITAVALIVMLAMAALAIDVVTLYVASGEAQKSADAGALAGAKAFVSSGFTSWQLGDPSSGVSQNLVCNGNTGPADYQAQAAAKKNLIARTAPTTVTTSCIFPAGNPQITVNVTRTGLPTFFARIWSRGASSVSGTAKAEAYNPSGSSTVPIQVHSVKPWLIPNCAPPCTSPAFFNTSTYDIVPTFGATFIGTSITLKRIPLGNNPAQPVPSAVHFYPINIPILPPDAKANPVCPSSSAVSCSSLGAGPQSTYHDNIACSSNFEFSCGQQIGPSSTPPITVDTGVPVQIKNATIDGTKCLIHADNTGLGEGQDVVNPVPAGAPVTIAGGYNNPNSALRPPASSISRSDSVVTVPVYDGSSGNLCPGGTCNQNTIVIGFLQLGIQDVATGPPGDNIHAVILNAAGCNPSAASNQPVEGGGVSPVPVRLTQ